MVTGLASVCSPGFSQAAQKGTWLLLLEVCDTYRSTDTHSESWALWVRMVLDSNARHTSWTVQESKLPRVKLYGCTSIIMPTIIFKKKSTKGKHLPQGEENMGKEPKKWTKVLVALSAWQRRGLISRRGRISGLMWTLILKQCVFIAGDHKT